MSSRDILLTDYIPVSSTKSDDFLVWLDKQTETTGVGKNSGLNAFFEVL